MQVTRLIALTAFLVSSTSAKCFLTGANWPSTGDAVGKLGGVCDKSKGHYDASEVYSVCVNGPENIRYNFEIQNNSGEGRDLSKTDCIGGLSKEIVNCGKGGRSTTADWQYRSDPNSGAC